MPSHVTFACPHCQRSVDIPPGTSPDTRLMCPGCQQLFAGPGEEAATRTLEQQTATLPPAAADAHQETTVPDRDALRGTLTLDQNSTAEAKAVAPDAAQIPQKIGRFEIRRWLGEGAFGVVYEAYDPQLDRPVALKVAKLGGDSAHRVKRFLREAKSAANLRHPNIVPLYEYGQDGEQFYIASAFIQGESLADDLALFPSPATPGEGSGVRAVPDLERAARIVRQLAEALSYAHSQGIVHRDVKPANVMLDDKDEPMLMDFGLATRQEEAEKLTHAGQVMGTPRYMAPEQAKGASGSALPASDQYSLGVMLFEMITGQPPFEGTVELVMFHHMETEPPRPSKLNGAVSRDLETICLKCLAKGPEKRYASAHDLAGDMGSFLRGEPIKARPLGKLEQAWKWARRRPAAAALLVVTLTGILMTLGLSYWYTYSLADARGKAYLIDKERAAAEEKRKNAEELALTQEYFALLMQSREKIAEKEPGWPSAALELISKAAGLATQSRKPADLRSAAIACMAGIEVRPAGKIAEGFSTSALAFHPKGHQIALAEHRTSGLQQFSLRVRVLEFPSGKLVRELDYPVNFAAVLGTSQIEKSNSIAWSPNGRWLAVGTKHGNVHVWDLTKTEAPRSLSFGTTNADSLVFHRDRDVLFAAATPRDLPHILKSWDLNEAPKEALSRQFSHIRGIGILPDANHILVSEQGRICHLDVSTLKTVKNTVDTNYCHMTTASEGRIALVVAGNRVVWFDPARYVEGHTFRSVQDAKISEISFIRASAEANLFLTRTSNKILHFWDAVTGQHFAEWPVVDGEADADFHPSGRWVAYSDNKEVHILEVVRSPETHKFGLALQNIQGMGLSPDGKYLTTIVDNGAPSRPVYNSIWDMKSPSQPIIVIQTSEGTSRFLGSSAVVRHHPKRREIACLAVFGGTVDIYDIPGKQNAAATRLHAPRDCAYSTDGQQLWIAHDKKILVLVGEGRKQQRFAWQNNYALLSGEGHITAVAVSDEWAAVGDDEGFLRLFSTKLPSRSNILSSAWEVRLEYRLQINTLAFSPNQKHLLAGDRVGNLYKFDPLSRSIEKRKLHSQSLTAVGFLSDEIFVTGTRDGSVRFWRWEGKEPEELFHLRASGPVLQLSPAKQARLLAILVEHERGVHLWDLSALWRRFDALNVSLPTLP